VPKRTSVVVVCWADTLGNKHPHMYISHTMHRGAHTTQHVGNQRDNPPMPRNSLHVQMHVILIVLKQKSFACDETPGPCIASLPSFDQESGHWLAILGMAEGIDWRCWPA
jgi:hypothetical protein